MLLLNKHYFQTMKYLLIKSIKFQNNDLFDEITNRLIWSTLQIILFVFIMPRTIPENTFEIFLSTILISSNAFFSATNSIYTLLFDITNDTSGITYELILPIPQWLIFAKYAFEIIYKALATSILTLCCCKLILWNNFSLQYFSFIKFYFIITISSLFYGFFTIFIASICKNMNSELNNIWMRIIFPMWFFGGSQYSWKTLYEISPKLAYINLLNPLLYTIEGARAAALNPQLSLPYWLCILAIVFFSIIFGYIGIKNLKRRMDCL